MTVKDSQNDVSDEKFIEAGLIPMEQGRSKINLQPKTFKGSLPRTAAFSLVEILVTTGIIAVLLAAGTGVYQKSLGKAKMTREMAAGRSLISAYLAAASDNDGKLMPGMDYTVNRVYFQPYDRDITTIHVPNRYPFRLAPYFDYRLEGVILVNQDRNKVKTDYNKSAFPSFGINYYLVGGQVNAGGQTLYPNECITRVAQAERPILVFASGGTGTGADYTAGYNILNFPKNWSSTSYLEGADPGRNGNVDARFEGKALAVFLDGSVQLKSIEELSDMRLWCANAAIQDDRDYTPASN